MNDIRALCFDVDGTLINDDKDITPATRKYINLMVEKSGCRVVFASSRMPRSLRNLAGEVEVDCDIVAYDGGYCVRADGEVLDASGGPLIEGYDASAFDDIAFGPDLFCALYAGEEWIVSGEGYWLGREKRSTKIEPDVIDEGALRAAIAEGKPLNKIMFRGDPEAIAEVKAKLARALEGLNAYSNKPSIIEYLPKGISKADGVAAILGLPREDLAGVIAFGDGFNDVPLMQAAQWSVAMGNAVPDCADAAGYRTLDNNSDGIAAFLQGFLAGRGIAS